MDKKPYNIPNPPEGFIYYGLGPIRAADYDYGQDLSGTDGPNGTYSKWSVGRWDGSDECTHYAIRAGSELARLNGLEEGWQKVSEVGWPKDSDYPVWLWHPNYGLRWAKKHMSCMIPCSCDFEPAMVDHVDYCDDEGFTHWKHMPFTKPEPPTNTAAEDRIREAERKLEEVKKELEEARKAL